jgi:hypothetical protein
MVSERISEEMAAIQNAVSSHIGVSEFYGGKTVFITGGTGFMGKVLLEKLLRSCPGVSKIYLLIRPKKGQDAHERLKLLLCSPVSHISFRFPPDPSGGESGISSDASFFFVIAALRPHKEESADGSAQGAAHRGRHHPTGIGDQSQRQVNVGPHSQHCVP